MAASDKGKPKLSFESLDLINLVRDKPELWDKSAQDYLDSTKKEHAWQEICGFLIPEYSQDLEDKKRKAMIAAVKARWKHLRGAYRTSLVTKSGQNAKTSYIYHNQMSFLQKIFETDVTEDSLADAVDLDADSNDENCIDRPARASFARKRKTPDLFENAVVAYMSSKAQRKRDNDDDGDMQFLNSLAPMIAHLSQAEKLEFRFDVLKLLREKYALSRGGSASSRSCDGTSLCSTPLSSPPMIDTPQPNFSAQHVTPRFTNASIPFHDLTQSSQHSYGHSQYPFGGSQDRQY